MTDEEPDTRPRRMRALIDELRTEAADIEEQTALPSLTRIRIYSRWLLSAVDELEKDLANAKGLTDGAL